MAVLRLFSFKLAPLAVVGLLIAGSAIPALGGPRQGYDGSIRPIGPYGMSYGIGMGYGGYGPGFLSSPSYGAYSRGYTGGYSPSYYGSYPSSRYDYGSGLPYLGGPTLYATPGVTGYSSAYPPQRQRQALKDAPAHLTVIVPKDAELWFEGVKTSQQGTERHFVTPSLTPGERYSYEVKARWMQDGKPVEEVRTVHVRANGRQQIDLTRPGS
jgi:uncharacterized protein (TIGR03000 family)